MANSLFAFKNHADDNDAFLSGGSWETTLPLTNLQDRRVHRVARATDAQEASTTFDIDLGAERYISVIALFGHNLSLTATVRVYGDDAATFASPDYDSTALAAYPDIYPTDMPQWIASGDRDGALTAEDWADGYDVPFIHVPSTAQSARYWRIAISDTGNPQGYVEVGRLFIASSYQPTVNFIPGATLGWETTSTRTETDGGAVFHRERARRRQFACTFENVDEDEALVHMMEMDRVCGTHKQFLFVYDPADTYHMHRRSFLATMERLNPLSIPYGSWHGKSYAIVEDW